MEDYQKDRKVDFNASMGLALELLALRQKANSCFISGDILTFFSCLRAMKMSTIATLKAEERAELRKLESEILEQFSLKQKGNKGFVKEQSYFLALTKIDILCGLYNEKLMDMLQKRGWLSQEKADTTHFAGVTFEK